jgi:hypothetical protein
MNDLLIAAVHFREPMIYIGLGNLIAAGMSWSRNENFFWAGLAFIVGWPYVVWYLLTD